VSSEPDLELGACRCIRTGEIRSVLSFGNKSWQRKPIQIFVTAQERSSIRDLGGCLSRGRMVLPFSSKGNDFPGLRDNRLSYLRLQVNGLLVSCARHYLHRAPNAAAPPVTYHRIRDSDVWHLRPLATQEDSDSITGGTRSSAAHDCGGRTERECHNRPGRIHVHASTKGANM